MHARVLYRLYKYTPKSAVFLVSTKCSAYIHLIRRYLIDLNIFGVRHTREHNIKTDLT